MNKVYLGLGSNVGDRLKNLVNMAVEINKLPGSRIVNVSSIYETKPFGVKEQNDFFNAAVELYTKLDLQNVHEASKRIENILGRQKTYRWGPRKIDIDILLFNDEVVSDEHLTVPHKDLLNRDFVLLPLLEICGEFVYPPDGRLIDKTFLMNLDKYVSEEIISSEKYLKLILQI
ncbi:MAG: 2-amino-4-hydroxy-6-hydroxymethyldihydropteridine diphosphokinase [Chlorobi bacterium]|nr:2-amino-4-hydroxy-6-hydroxymethyldihydropteridine diphosphokinase [Chlorobiota bacterium]